MAIRDATLSVRMDPELKREGKAVLAEIGLSVSDAVSLLFHRLAEDRAFPLELKQPNAETRAAMAESEMMIKQARTRLERADEGTVELEEASRQ